MSISRVYVEAVTLSYFATTASKFQGGGESIDKTIFKGGGEILKKSTVLTTNLHAAKCFGQGTYCQDGKLYCVSFFKVHMYNG